MVSFALYLTDVCPSAGNPHVHGQMPALGTKAGEQRKHRSAEQPPARDGGVCAAPWCYKGPAFLSLHCGCASWASQGREKRGETRFGFWNENHAFDISGWVHGLNLLVGFKDDSEVLSTQRLVPFPLTSFDVCVSHRNSEVVR